MTAEAIFTQLLNGLTAGCVLMLVAMGLTLIFGMMGVMNFAHGSLYMLGAYLGLAVTTATGAFWPALMVAPLGVGLVGLLMERLLIRPLYGRDAVLQVLLTFGAALVLREAIEIIWGPRVQSLAPPAVLDGAVEFLGIRYPAYRLAVLAFAAGVAATLWLVLRRTNIGLIIRAATYDRDMVGALGINVERVFAVVFVAGTMLAALAGVLIGPLRSVHPEMGTEVIVDAFIVVIVGGLGSVPGAVVGALLVGVAELLGALVIPGMAKASIYAIVAAILLVKPTGFFSTERSAA